jgi:hypothetical protein
MSTAAQTSGLECVCDCVNGYGSKCFSLRNALK